MKIVVLGAGAMGGMFAARLAKSGNDVTAIDVWKDHVEKINKNGVNLQVRGKDAGFWPLKATTDYNDIKGVVDLIIVFVKGTFTKTAMEAAKKAGFIGKNTYVLTIQNGVGNGETISEVVPADQVIIGVTACSSVLLEAGKINDTSERIPGQPNTHIASLTQKQDKKIQEIADVLTKAELGTDVSDNVLITIWSKLAINCAANGPCVLTRVDMGTMGKSPYIQRLHDQIVRELVDVANAKGIKLEYDKIRSNVKAIHDSSTHHPSMAQDAFKKNPTEIETITGAIVRGGKETGIPTPVNETIFNLVHVVQDNYDKRWY
jgi:2-dehydropantoate 2-reductase